MCMYTCVYIAYIIYVVHTTYIAYIHIMVIKVYENYSKNNTIILGSSFSMPTCQYDPIGYDRKQDL